MRESLLGPKGDEGVAVEAREAVAGAEPEKAPGILYDTTDVVVRQTVSGREALDRQPLGPDIERAGKQQQNGEPEHARAQRCPRPAVRRPTRRGKRTGQLLTSGPS